MQDDRKWDMFSLPYYILSNSLGIDLHNFIIVMLSLRYIEPNAKLV